MFSYFSHPYEENFLNFYLKLIIHIYDLTIDWIKWIWLEFGDGEKKRCIIKNKKIIRFSIVLTFRKIINEQDGECIEKRRRLIFIRWLTIIRSEFLRIILLRRRRRIWRKRISIWRLRLNEWIIIVVIIRRIRNLIYWNHKKCFWHLNDERIKC